MQLKFDILDETTEIRKSPNRKEHTYLSTYRRRSVSNKISTELAIGTQKRFINAARIAGQLGTPLNTLLTIRWDSLFCDRDVNPLRTMATPERIDHLVELMRKWLVRNEQPPFYIWVRESARNEGEHWHIAFSLSKSLRRRFAPFVGKLTGEPLRKRRRSSVQFTEGEFACGELASWHLAQDTNPERQGLFLAAYLGKAEPSQRLVRGILKDNTNKPIRGRTFGGDQPDDKYDAEQGRIEGNAFRGDRFFIAKALQRHTRIAAEKV